jgi:hypothetical protein
LSAQQQHREEQVVAVELLCSPALLLGTIAITAFVLWLSFSVIFGVSESYYRFFGLVTFAHLAMSLKGLLTAFCLCFGDVVDMNRLANPIGTNPGFFLDMSTDLRVRSLLTSLDLFNVWYVVILVIGCAAITQMQIRKAAPVLASWTLVIVISRMAWAAMSGDPQ